MKRFTLIELLVVVAIIGILASILMPSLSGARLRTIKAVCLSNTSQLGKAFVANSDNYDGRIFWDESGNNGNWPWSLSLKNIAELDLPQQAYWCPVQSSYDNESAWDFMNGFNVTAYTYNFKRPSGGMSGATLSGGMQWVDKLGSVENPVDTPLVTDAVFNGNSGGFFSTNPFGTRTNHTDNQKIDQNSMFVDGHAKLRSISSIQERYNGGNGWFWW
ncbi:MAG: prepilin-type N-terminal cleavage/methylation domain-containing protein [Lentisphaeraceae bacterium]|nr:prepilin-type N-terminal cleavage/methylation domain-containing protein [Lentisphaeraceae bacterium]